MNHPNNPYPDPERDRALEGIPDVVLTVGEAVAVGIAVLSFIVNALTKGIKGTENGSDTNTLAKE